MAIIAIVSCQSASLPVVVQDKTLETIVVKKLGEGAFIEKNKNATFALGIKEVHPTLSAHYIIVRLSDLTVVEEDHVSRSSFGWTGTYILEIKAIPGMVRKNEEPSRAKIIDLTKYIVKL